jgi:hypothetical protein
VLVETVCSLRCTSVGFLKKPLRLWLSIARWATIRPYGEPRGSWKAYSSYFEPIRGPYKHSSRGIALRSKGATLVSSCPMFTHLYVLLQMVKLVLDCLTLSNGMCYAAACFGLLSQASTMRDESREPEAGAPDYELLLYSRFNTCTLMLT